MLLMAWLQMQLNLIVKCSMELHVSHNFDERVGVLELLSETDRRDSDTAHSIQLYGGTTFISDLYWSYDSWNLEVKPCFTGTYFHLDNVPNTAVRSWWIYKIGSTLRIFCNRVKVFESVLPDRSNCVLTKIAATSFKFYYRETATTSFRIVPCKYIMFRARLHKISCLSTCQLSDHCQLSAPCQLLANQPVVCPPASYLPVVCQSANCQLTCQLSVQCPPVNCLTTASFLTTCQLSVHMPVVCPSVRCLTTASCLPTCHLYARLPVVCPPAICRPTC